MSLALPHPAVVAPTAAPAAGPDTAGSPAAGGLACGDTAGSPAAGGLACGDTAGGRVEALVREHLDFVWRLIRRMGVPEFAADDLAQQVCLVAARRIAAIEPGSEASFLYGTALRVVKDHRRSQARRRDQPGVDAVLDPVDDATPGPEEALERARALRRLDALLGELPDDLREVFVLFELEGLTTPEIARVAGVPLGTAASRLRRAREAFQQALARQRQAP